MGLRKLPQANVHPNFKSPIPGEAVVGQLHAAPAPLGIGLQVRDKVAVLQVLHHIRCSGVHAALQPGLHRFQIDSGLPEIVGISPKIIADIGDELLPHHILIAEVLQDTVRQRPGKGPLRGFRLLSMMEERVSGHAVAEGCAGDDGHIQKPA